MAFKLLYEYASTEEAAIKFLQDRGALRSEAPECVSCGRSLTLVRNGARKQKFWRCPSHKNIKISIRNSSYWEKCQLSHQKIVELLFLWAFKMSNHVASEFVGLSEYVVGTWYQNFRDICSRWLECNPYFIGGPGVIVEVDECLGDKEGGFDRNSDKRMVFGAVCPSTGQGFLEMITDKTSDILLTLIEERIAPGSIIITNKSEVYDSVTTLPVDPPFEQSIFTKDSCSSTHVKLYWRRCKRRFDDMAGVPPLKLQSYVDEFMWRELHGRTGKDVLDNLLSHLSVWYSFGSYMSV